MMAIISQQQDSTPHVTADMLEALIARHPESEARIHRGATLVAAGAVESTRIAGLMLVCSATDPHRAYRVDAAACDCMDHTARGVFCQHMAARALFLAAERAEAEAGEPCVTCGGPMGEEARWSHCCRACTNRAYAEMDAEQAAPFPQDCPYHGQHTQRMYDLDGSVIYVCITCGGIVEKAAPPPMAGGSEDAEARYALTGAGYLALVPTAALPVPVGTITVLSVPLSPEARARDQELFGGDAA